jgi:hypothetical protein
VEERIVSHRMLYSWGALNPVSATRARRSRPVAVLLSLFGSRVSWPAPPHCWLSDRGQLKHGTICRAGHRNAAIAIAPGRSKLLGLQQRRLSRAGVGVHALSGTTLMLGAEVLFQLAQEWLLPATFAHHILALPSILAVDCEFRQCRGPEKIQKRWEPRMRARPSAALSNQNGRVLTHERLGLVRYVTKV